MTAQLIEKLREIQKFAFSSANRLERFPDADRDWILGRTEWLKTLTEEYDRLAQEHVKGDCE